LEDKYSVNLWKVENHEPPRFCVEVNVPRGQKLDILWLQSAMVLPYSVLLRLLYTISKQCYFNQLFYDLNIFTTVLAKSFENDTNINFHKVCCLSLYEGNLHILQNVMKSDQINCNSLKSPSLPYK
jgi:hypothetical protein